MWWTSSTRAGNPLAAYFLAGGRQAAQVFDYGRPGNGNGQGQAWPGRPSGNGHGQGYGSGCGNGWNGPGSSGWQGWNNNNDDCPDNHDGRASSYTRWHITDGLGSVVALTDDNGFETDQYRYDAWGNTLAQQGPSYNPFRYTGQQLDDGNRDVLPAGQVDGPNGRTVRRSRSAWLGRWGKPLCVRSQ